MAKKEKKPLLSISLLSCGHEPHIEDCLRALMPLKDELGAEIVVVDTSPEKSGSVRGIIEKYADEVVDFDWCDDFARARNAGLLRCSGEWFFFVDDDEVIEDASPIIDFFSSGEHKKYNTASVIIRNYINIDEGRYNEQWTPRMYRLVDVGHFEHCVHERFVPASYPLAAVHVHLLHYGYVFDDQEAIEKHSMRNIRLIEKDIAKYPEDIGIQLQLVQEYAVMKDTVKEREKALECLNCIHKLGKNTDRQTRVYEAICYAYLLRADRLERKYDEGIKRLSSLKKRKRFTAFPVARAFFAYEGMLLYDGLDDSVGRTAEANEYMAIYENIKGSLDKYVDEQMFCLGETFNSHIIEGMRDVAQGLDPETTVKIRFRYAKDSKYTEEFFEEMFAPKSDPFTYDIEAWEYATAAETDIEERILSYELSYWRECADRFAAGASAKEISRIHSCLKTIQKTKDIHYSYYFMRADEWMLLAFVRDHDGELPGGYDDLSATYSLFQERLSGFCENISSYSETFADEDTRRQKELAERISPLLELPDSEAVTLLNGIKGLLGIYPDFDPVLVYFVHLYGTYIKEKGAHEKREAETAEMRRIIDALQQKVQELVSAGMVEEADKLLQEIQKYTDMMG